MTSNYYTPDLIQGQIDLDDKFVTDSWLVDQWVGGTLFSCGYNNKGQLGNGSITNYSSPIQIGSLTNWKQIGANIQRHIAAVKTDGTLWACGYNFQGMLGNGTSGNSYSSPIQIGSLTNWKQVAVGQAMTMMIKTDGTLWGCGYNQWGELGNGTQTKYVSPIQIGSLANWKQVACGGSASAAVKNDGTLWTWGSNRYGQLGNGTGVYYSSPIQVGSLTNWKQVVCGYSGNMFAIKTDGTLWGCGYNPFGQLGNGTNVSYSSPIQIGSLTNWKQVSGGLYHTAAIKTDGTLWTWGYNAYGMLGNSTTVIYSSPIQIGSLTNWKQVSGGLYQTQAIKTDGTLWVCGDNNKGELGNSTTIGYSSPIQVGALTNWKSVASGNRSIFAITFTDLG